MSRAAKKKLKGKSAADEGPVTLSLKFEPAQIAEAERIAERVTTLTGIRVSRAEVLRRCAVAGLDVVHLFERPDDDGVIEAQMGEMGRLLFAGQLMPRGCRKLAIRWSPDVARAPDLDEEQTALAATWKRPGVEPRR